MDMTYCHRPVTAGDLSKALLAHVNAFDIPSFGAAAMQTSSCRHSSTTADLDEASAAPVSANGHASDSAAANGTDAAAAAAAAAADDASFFLRRDGEPSVQYAARVFKRAYEDDIERVCSMEVCTPA